AMSIATLPVRAVQPQPITVHCETTRRGAVEDAEARVRWLRRPQARPDGRHNAILEVNGTPSPAEAFHTDDGEGRRWLVIDRGKVAANGLTLDAEHYRLTRGPDGEHCDCPHATYRGVLCKHTAGVVLALDQLDALERAEWRAEVAAADVDAALAP